MLILCPSLPSATATDAPFDWVRSASGQVADEHGQSQVALLPTDAEIVLVVPVPAMSWHRVNLPKVPAKRVRAVLEGLLEEQVLQEVAELHLALEPGARPGQTVWVCACDRTWLKAILERMEAAGRPVSRIVPAIWPASAGSTGIVHHAFHAFGAPWLASSTPEGVSLLPLDSLSGIQSLTGLATTTAEPPAVQDGPDTTWLADPSVIGLAEERLAQRFAPLPAAEHLLRCAASPWNLAQFDLSLSSGARMGQRWRQHWRSLVNAPQWRPTRWGLAALVLACLGGLNTAAWMERRALESKAAAIEQTLRASFSQVQVVLDAPVQMQQELRRLRSASGALGPHDLEALLGAVGRSLPPEAAPPTRLSYDGRALVLAGWNGSAQALETVRDSLVSQGLDVRVDGEQLRVEPVRD